MGMNKCLIELKALLIRKEIIPGTKKTDHLPVTNKVMDLKGGATAITLLDPQNNA